MRRWTTRKLVATAAVLAVAVVGAPLGVLAATGPSTAGATGSGGSHMNCQAFAFRTSSVSTSSTSFTNIPGLGVSVVSVFGMTAPVSLVLSGDPVQIRVTDASVGGTFPMAPGVVSFDPTGAPTGFSFTFVDEGTPAPHSHTLRVQWRVLSPGTTASLGRGDISLLYEAGDAGCPFV